MACLRSASACSSASGLRTTARGTTTWNSTLSFPPATPGAARPAVPDSHGTPTELLRISYGNPTGQYATPWPSPSYLPVISWLSFCLCRPGGTPAFTFHSLERSGQLRWCAHRRRLTHLPLFDLGDGDF